MVNDTRVENAESIPLIWDAFLQDNHWEDNNWGWFILVGNFIVGYYNHMVNICQEQQDKRVLQVFIM